MVFYSLIFCLCLGISVLAECLDCPELKATADDFIHQHFTEVYKTDEFLQLDVKRVTHLLNQDTLTVRAEDQVTKVPSHIFLSENVLSDFLCLVFGYMTRKRIILGENVFFTFNRVFQSLFHRKSKSRVLVKACPLRERPLDRDKAIVYHGRQNSASPKDVHVLIPRTWEYVTLHGKWDFVDVVKDLKMRRLSGWAQCNQKGP